MIRNALRSALPAVGALLLFGCNGADSGDDDKVPMFERPQILPDRSPICMSFQPTTVGKTDTYVALFRNDGRQQLVIDGAMLEEDSRGYFELTGVDPMAVNSFENSHVQFKYTPMMEGWDYAYLRVVSNAANYPMIRVFILALGRPENAPMDWDPGPKPEIAGSGMDEACQNQFDPGT